MHSETIALRNNCTQKLLNIKILYWAVNETGTIAFETGSVRAIVSECTVLTKEMISGGENKRTNLKHMNLGGALQCAPKLC